MKRKNFISFILIFIGIILVHAVATAQNQDPTQTVCEGSTEPYGVESTDSSTYNWFVSGSLNVITYVNGPNSDSINVQWNDVPGNYILGVVETDSNGCVGDTVSVLVTITPPPVANAGLDDTICEGNTYTLSGTASDNSSVYWTTAGDGTFDDSTSLTATYTPGATDILNDSVVLSLTATGNATCGDSVDNMTLYITPSPVANAGADDTICQGNTYTLSGTASNSSSILWTTAGDGTFDDSTSLTAIYTPGAADISNGSVVLTLTANGNQPCGSVSDDMTLFVTAAATAYAGDDETICGNEGDIYTITNDSVSNNNGFSWATSGSGAFTDTTTLSPSYTLTADDITNGSVIFILTAYGNSPCGDVSDTMTLTITQAPSVIAGSNSPVCQGGDLHLTATTITGGTYTWTGPNGYNSNVQNPVITNVTPANSGTYTVTVTNIPGGCSDATDSVDVTVNL